MKMIPSTDLSITDYVALDLETTGLSPQKSEILEIGIIKVRNKRAIAKMEVLIKPRCGNIPFHITRLTGITNEMVMDCPDISQVREYIWSFIGNDIIIGYNIRFDLNFLKQHAPKQGAVQYIDVYPLCKKAHPQFDHCRLSDMTRLYKLHKNTHRACDDALATAQLFELSKRWRKNTGKSA